MAPRKAAIAAVLAVSAALAACGGEEAEEPSAPPPEAGEAPARTGDEGSGGDSERTPDKPAGSGEPGPEPSGAEAPEASDGERPKGCVFRAPEGRLARAEVAIELDGVPCAEATPLARAAALGQPAGANLTIESGGFECEPSTVAKGVNVTYTCSGDSGSARFDVVWSERGG